MRQDAQAALRCELDRLNDAANPDDQEYFQREFDSFASLFERFLDARGPSVEWEQIKPPAEGMVRLFNILKYNLKGQISKSNFKF